MQQREHNGVRNMVGRLCVTLLLGSSLFTLCACRSTGDWTSNWNRHPGSRDNTWTPAQAGVQSVAPQPRPAQPSVEVGHIMQISHAEPDSASSPQCPAALVNGPYCGTHPRIPLPHMSHEDYARAELMAQGGPTVVYRDEYIFDGGDRAKPAHYSGTPPNGLRQGFDTEDTIVEYRDHTGKHKVKPTNRVAIYSPRFAAVRTVSVPAAGIGARKIGSFDIGNRVAGVGVRIGPANHKGRSVPDAVRVRSRGSGLDGDRKLASGVHITRAATQRKNVVPVENLTFIKSGTLERTEQAVLALGIQAAAVWTKRQYPLALLKTKKSGEVSGKTMFNEYIGRESMLKKPGKLRVVKLADRKEAKPGEVITFTIRYDNLGEKELTNLVIIDNLTPRLEFVKKSHTGDRLGELFVEDNQEGSLVLKFQISEPLRGGEGGFIKFQAKVR